MKACFALILATTLSPLALSAQSSAPPAQHLTQDADPSHRSQVPQGIKVHEVAPIYPPLARTARVQGSVVLAAVIGKDGTVQSLHVISGPPLLTQAALDAVKQWRYKPYVLNGETVQVESQVTLNFSLADSDAGGQRPSCTFAVGQTRDQIVAECGEPARYYDPQLLRSLSTKSASSTVPIWEVYSRKTAVSDYEIHLLYRKPTAQSFIRLQEVRFVPDRVLNAETVVRDITEVVALCANQCQLWRIVGEPALVGNNAIASFIATKETRSNSDWRTFNLQQLVFAQKFSLDAGERVGNWSPSTPKNSDEVGSTSATAAQVAEGPRKGPFGFRFGLTKQECIAMVGRQAVAKEEGDRIEFKAAPKAHPDFESYTVVISPERGLLKLIGVSKDVETTKYGDELQSKFSELKSALEETYGPSKTYDLLRSGSIWNEPEDWMIGLLKKERTLDAFWQFKDNENHITGIGLEANALSTEKGFLDIFYEFDGWSAYVASKKAKSNKVF